MTSQLEQEVAHYQQWRAQMISGIESYKTWLDANGYADIQQSLRIYDLIESLRNDRMTLAFLAEFSRGKTELINAMFFADFKQRLLPSNVGRTTMCPTEIFHDPADEPYIRLLPIETRKRQESVSTLKRQTVEWIKVRLDIDSREEMANAMKHLVEVKTVPLEEAKSLGLWSEDDPLANSAVVKDGDQVEIPAWRHAVISYPHPLLKSGLVVLDTPGLNALGTEPELTLSMIPNAHAILFLLGIDTGVTKSDLEVWRKFVQPAATRRIVVLNKVDLMWDDLKTGEQIDADVARQVEATSALLELPRSHVLAVSAQKALIGRVREDEDLLAKSGIRQLEHLLAAEIIPAKREIMRAAVQREIGSMVEASHNTVVAQLAATHTELKDLAAMAGKNRSMAQSMIARLEGDRKNYRETAHSFQVTHTTVTGQGATLLKQLDDAAIEAILNKDREFIEGAWTTAGLWKNMQRLFLHFTLVSSRLLNFANQIKGLVDLTYDHFHQKFGFAKLTPPALNVEKHTLTMTGLQATAHRFCHDPVNVAKYKDFVVQKFYEGLVAEARQVFEMTRLDVENWVKSALSPLNLQIREHEKVLAKRLENFRKIRDNIGSVESRIKELESQRHALEAQHAVLSRIRSSLADGAAPPPATATDAARATPAAATATA